MTLRRGETGLTVLDELFDRLEHGPSHRFADFETLAAVVPAGGAGVYTIWLLLLTLAVPLLGLTVMPTVSGSWSGSLSL